MLTNLLRRIRGAPPEKRAAAAGYTSEIIAARESYLAGTSGLGELTATVQACVSLWESGLSIAAVEGTDLLDRRTLALTARGLALRGEALFLIGDGRLIPAADWDLRTRDGEPVAYRLTVSEAGGGRAMTALAGEVLHVRLAADPVAPWAGQAPLRRASISAALLHEIESALRDVFRDGPLGSNLVPLPDSTGADMAEMRRAFKGKRGGSLVIEGVAQATAAGMNPQLGQRPESVSPDLSKSMTAETHEAARGAILAAYGVLPSLFAQAAQGPLVREAQRHLASWMLQPVAELVAEEAGRKLEAPVSLDVLQPLQAFDAGGRARAAAGIVNALAQAKEAGLDVPTVAKAFAQVGWNSPQE